MRARWSTARWIAMLALASLVLATLVSVAVVGGMPRPPPPPMRLDQAIQVLRGERSAAALGLHLETRASAPEGTSNDWLTHLVAAQLRQPLEHVKLVWGRRSKAGPCLTPKRARTRCRHRSRC